MALTRRAALVGMSLTPLLTAQAAPAWSEGAPAPFAVQEIYPALHEGSIWIAGGFSPQMMGATERVIAYDIANDTWRDGPPLPTPSHHVHLASWQGALWAIGGFIGGASRMNWTCTQRVLRLEGAGWIEGPPLPKPIGEATPLVHQERIHVIGGRSPAGPTNSAWSDHADVADHFVMAVGATQWESAPPLPMARNSAAIAAIGGAIHVVSGRTVQGGQTGAHHVYDARSGEWREAAAFPEPRGGLAAAVLNGKLIAGGGEIFSPPSVGDALYEYEEAAGWTRAPMTLPTPRHGYGLVEAGGALYALGGARNVGGNGTLASLDIYR